VAVYLDTSAFLKLVVVEAHSTALRAWAEARQDALFSSDLLVTESRRAARRHSPAAEAHAIRLLEAVVLVRMGPAIFERAATLEPLTMRSLDALHLAAAQSVGAELDAFATYDERLAASARTAGIAVEAPT